MSKEGGGKSAIHNFPDPNISGLFDKTFKTQQPGEATYYICLIDDWNNYLLRNCHLFFC